jgi:hypothetical protein
MQTIGIRELKNRLSEVLRAVKAGERAIGAPSVSSLYRGAPASPETDRG